MTHQAPTLPPVAHLGFGQVRHTRLRPVRNAFAYAGYFLMLPMRALQREGSAHLACNRMLHVEWACRGR